MRAMKLSLCIAAMLICSLSWQIAIAESVSSGCEAAKEKAWKAKQVVDERQRVVQLAQRETRLAYSQLVECRPGAIFSASRAHRCAQAQSDVPLQVRDQRDAEDQLQVALANYQETLEWVRQECTSDEPMVNQNELLLRIALLEDEIKELTNLVEQLNAR